MVLLWFSFASMASSWTSLYAPAARGWSDIPRAPGGGARPVPGLRPEASGSERSQCRADLPATLCGLANDLHEAQRFGQPGGRVKRSRITNQRLRQVRTNHLQPGTTAGSGSRADKQHSQTAQPPAMSAAETEEEAPPPQKKSIFSCLTNLPGVCVPQKSAEGEERHRTLEPRLLRRRMLLRERVVVVQQPDQFVELRQYS